MRRLIAHPVRIVAAGLLLVVAGCVPDPFVIAGQPAAKAGDEAAADELRAALDKLAVEPVSVEASIGDDVTMTGSVDPTTRSSHTTISMALPQVPYAPEFVRQIEELLAAATAGEPVEAEVIYIGTDLWISLGELNEQLGVETTWMYWDASLWVKSGIGIDTLDPATFAGHNPELLAASLEKVVKVDDHTFEGEIDPLAGFTVTLGDLTPPKFAIDEFPFTFTFTAVLDDGQLTRLHLTVVTPSGVSGTIEVRYLDHGVPVDIPPPPDEEVSDMPAEVFEWFLGLSE